MFYFIVLNCLLEMKNHEKSATVFLVAGWENAVSVIMYQRALKCCYDSLFSTFLDVKL